MDMQRDPRVASDLSDASGKEPMVLENSGEEPMVLEEIEVEDLAVDGICGVY